MRYVYHVSGTSGIRIFVPRKYWHIDYVRSGPVTAEVDVPANAEVITCFYASSADYVPFYFPPKHCRRILLSRRKHAASFDLLAPDLRSGDAEIILVFEDKDRSSLIFHEFSIYSFDMQDFQRLPNGEFVAHQAVVPVDEVRHQNALKNLIQAGWHVEFVEDLLPTKQMMLDHGWIPDSEGI